jgi:ATP-dependent Clp protease ATP-binding subunit ClpA
VDEVVAFSPLGAEEFRTIAGLLLKELAENLIERGLHFTWDEEAAARLGEKSFSQKYGARNLRRTIQKDVEDAIAGLIIDHAQNPVTHMKAVVKDGEVTVIGL